MPAQVNDLESEIFSHLEQAGKIANKELAVDIESNHIQTKSWHIRKAAEAAEIAGWPRKEIADRLWDAVEKHGYNISRRLIQMVCSPLGFVDETQARNVSADEKISSKTSSIYEDENAAAIELVDRVVSFLKDVVRKKLSDGPFLSQVNAANPRIWPEHEHTIGKLLETAKQCWDERQTCPVVAQHMLMTEIIAHSVAGGAEMFQTKVKRITLTPKQTTKYRHGEVRELLPIYDPKNRNEAILAGFYGQQCKCKSWRVKLDKEATDDFKLHCFACLATFEPVTLKLPTTQGVELDKKIDNVLANYEQWKKENKIG